jgi:hypothetical protein
VHQVGCKIYLVANFLRQCSDEREREGERETEREGRDREKEREIETRIVDIVGGGDRCLMAYALRDLETSRQHTP